MTAPADERPDEQQLYVVEPAPETSSRSESNDDTADSDRGRPVGQWVAGGGSVLGIGGSILYSTFGAAGLAVGAITAAGGTATYVAHRVRRNRSPFGRTTRGAGKSTSRLLSGGKGGPKLGRGKGPKLTGGRGAKLGKGGGPKLGRGGGKLLGGRGAKLGGGKSGKLLGGKAGKLGGGRSGRLLGGGRGSKLGGKSGLGKKGTTSRLGSVGKGGGRLLGRGGKSGIGLGKRGGKLLGGKGKTGLGRWGKSTGAGADLLGSKFGRNAKRLGGKARAAALRTNAGRRAGKGFTAAKAAMNSTTPGKGRWKTMRHAARSAMTSNRNPFAQWSASIAAALVTLTAMGHEKWKARHPEQGKDAAGTADAAKPAPTGTPSPKAEKTHEQELNEFKLATKERWLKESIEAFQKLKDAGELTPEDEAEHMANRRRRQNEIEQLRRAINPAPQASPGRLVHATTRRTTTVSVNFPIHEAAQEMQSTAAHYMPEDMWCVDMDLEQVPDIPVLVAEALQTYAQNLQAAYPINPAVVEALGRAYVALGQVSSSLQDLPNLFKQLHADDIKRKTQPRIGEDKWNV